MGRLCWYSVWLGDPAPVDLALTLFSFFVTLVHDVSASALVDFFFSTRICQIYIAILILIKLDATHLQRIQD